MAKNKERKITIVSITDVHYPFSDERAVNVALSFVKKVQPDIIITHELHDFYSLSSFDKNPDRSYKLQEEIDEVTKFFWALRKVCPKSRIILLKSNHLDRLRRYLWTQAPALSSLRSLNIANLLELKQHNVEYMETFEFRKVLFKHGDVVRRFSGQSAKGELEREGMSGVSGHTHRLSCYYSTLRGGKYFWIESGCLCETEAEYIDGTANWTQGISMVRFDGDETHAEVIPINNGKIIWGSLIFNA